MAFILTAARLIAPSSELGIEERFYPRTALEDICGVSEEQVNKDRLYRALDQLLPHKAALEAHLKSRIGTLFEGPFDILLYDLTSTYFEGLGEGNLQARRGYSRDHRPDCVQVVIGLVVTRSGLPLGYEVFACADRAVLTHLQAPERDARWRRQRLELRLIRLLRGIKVRRHIGTQEVVRWWLEQTKQMPETEDDRKVAYVHTRCTARNAQQRNGFYSCVEVLGRNRVSEDVVAWRHGSLHDAVTPDLEARRRVLRQRPNAQQREVRLESLVARFLRRRACVRDREVNRAVILDNPQATKDQTLGGACRTNDGLAPWRWHRGRCAHVFQAPSEQTAGIVAGTVSGVAYAIIVILGRLYARQYHPVVLTFLVNTTIIILLTPFIREFPRHAIWSYLFMGVVHSTIAPVLYYRGLRDVNATRTAVLGYLEPLCAILLAMFFLHERPDIRSLYGGILILFSGYLTVRAKHEASS